MKWFCKSSKWEHLQAPRQLLIVNLCTFILIYITNAIRSLCYFIFISSSKIRKLFNQLKSCVNDGRSLINVLYFRISVLVLFIANSNTDFSFILKYKLSYMKLKICIHINPFPLRLRVNVFQTHNENLIIANRESKSSFWPSTKITGWLLLRHVNKWNA